MLNPQQYYHLSSIYPKIKRRWFQSQGFWKDKKNSEKQKIEQGELWLDSTRIYIQGST